MKQQGRKQWRKRTHRTLTGMGSTKQVFTKWEGRGLLSTLFKSSLHNTKSINTEQQSGKIAQWRADIRDIAIKVKLQNNSYEICYSHFSDSLQDRKARHVKCSLFCQLWFWAGLFCPCFHLFSSNVFLSTSTGSFKIIFVHLLLHSIAHLSNFIHASWCVS